RSWLAAVSPESLLDTDRPYLLDVGDSLQHLLYAILLQRAHPVVEGGGEHLGHPRVLLDGLLDAIRADQELVQTDAALVAGVAADIAALGRVEDQFSLLVAEFPRPLIEQRGLHLLRPGRALRGLLGTLLPAGLLLLFGPRRPAPF